MGRSSEKRRGRRHIAPGLNRGGRERKDDGWSHDELQAVRNDQSESEPGGTFGRQFQRRPNNQKQEHCRPSRHVAFLLASASSGYSCAFTQHLSAFSYCTSTQKLMGFASKRVSSRAFRAPHV